MWRQVPFPSRDVVIVQLRTSSGQCTLVNIYNDNNHDETIKVLEQFLSTNIRELWPSEGDHMLWLGDFNCHHPLWDKDRNNHLFTAAALEASGRLLELVADYGIVQILSKGLPTLQSSSTCNWTCPDNMFCTEHTSEFLVLCNTAPEKRGPKTDHLAVLTVLDISMTASEESPTWNYRSVDWVKFCSTLSNKLTDHTGPPQILETAEEFQLAARNLDEALRHTVESMVPKTRPHPHTKRWWTEDLTKLTDKLKQLRKTAHKYRVLLLDHAVHAELQNKENTLSKEIQRTKEDHWKNWLNEMAGTNIWIAHKYISNPGGNGGKT